MPLAAQRPKSWNGVLGQERALRVLQAVLTNRQFMTRGYIFGGIRGVGKTSVAYLFARALMCTGNDPLGCGKCPSCLEVDRLMEVNQSPTGHPDFIEIDAAMLGKVEHARDLVERAENRPVLGLKRVVLVDEAHRQTKEAWDCHLKPLERDDTDVVYIYASTVPEDIPHTIDSRCTTLRFRKVPPADMVGMLTTLALDQGAKYELSGLRRIAILAKGKPRDAIRLFGVVAATGETITPALIKAVIDEDVEELCSGVFAKILADDLRGAIELADLTCQTIGPTKTVAALFSLYATEMFKTGSPVAAGFTALREMTRFFVEWSSSAHLPTDAIPLIVMELADLRVGHAAAAPLPAVIGWNLAAEPEPVENAEEPEYLDSEAMHKFLGGKRK